MSVWNINYGSDLVASMAQLNFQTDSNSNNSTVANTAQVSSDYAKILAEKISQVEVAMQEAKDNAKKQQNFSDGSTSAKSIETIKRFLPDGSMMITTYEDGKVSSQIKKRPHLVPVADYSAPPSPSGEVAIKMQQQFSLADLLMM